MQVVLLHRLCLGSLLVDALATLGCPWAQNPWGKFKKLQFQNTAAYLLLLYSKVAKMSFKGRKLEELPSPSFIVDVNKVKRNCERMKQRCDSLGVKLRPHMKTHKTL